MDERRKLSHDILSIWNPSGLCIAAEKWTSKQGKVGYSPVCQNKFDKKLCIISDGKPKPCSRCENKVFQTVTAEMILKNMQDTATRTLGIYPLINGNKCCWVAADIDKHRDNQEPEELLKKITEICSALQIGVSVFRSQSGNGFHVYIFFSETVEAKTARALLLAIIQNAKNAGCSEISAAAFDGVFPKQDSLNSLDIGNLIAMPFNGYAFSQNRGSCFVSSDNNFELQEDELTENIEMFLEDYQTLTGSEAENLIGQMGYEISDFQQAGSGKSIVSGTQKTGKTDADENSMFKTVPQLVDECAFLSHCRDNAAALSEPEWHAMIQVLVREHGGVPVIHELSKNYPGYDTTETNDKILQVLSYQSAPLTCRHIKTIHDCGKDCQVKCPVHLRSSSQRYKKSEIELETEEWVQDIVFGSQSKGDVLRAEIMRLAGYYIGRYGEDTEKVTERVLKWNKQNDHKLPDEEVIDLIGRAGDCKGREAFSAMIGFRVVSIERRINPDRRTETVYRLHVDSENKPIDLVFANFCNPSAFQKSFGSYVNYLCDIPTGKGAAIEWRNTVNMLLPEVVDVYIDEEDTELAVLRRKISDSLRNFKQHFKPEDDLHKMLDKYVIEKDGTIYLSLASIMNAIKFNPEVGKWTRNETTGFLEALGFEKPDKPMWFAGKGIRLWTMNAEKFYNREK